MEPPHLPSPLQKPEEPQDHGFITIVSGLPRSGTSMMMQMIESGGVTILYGNERPADESNPVGYYEYERVKKLVSGDTAWLEGAVGKAVKVISALLKYIPSSYSYKVIFMRRNLTEILASQRKMLLQKGEEVDKVPDEKMAVLFHKHLENIETWLDQQPSMQVLKANYNDILTGPTLQVERIQKFLGMPLNIERMLQVVDRSLYRQRHSALG